MGRKFRFVSVTNPTVPASAETLSAARSHAISAVHARRRREAIEAHRRQAKELNRGNEDQRDVPVVRARDVLSNVTNDYRDPFQTLASPLSDQDFFLLAYYCNVAVPIAAAYCPLFSYPGDHKLQIIQDWVMPALTDSALLVGAPLLGACRVILTTQPDNQIVSQLAIQYQQKSIQALLQSLASCPTRVTPLTVARAVTLVVDSSTAGDLHGARKHAQGVVTLVEQGGGLDALKLPKVLEMLCKRCILFEKLVIRNMSPVPFCGSLAMYEELLAN